MAPLVGSKYSSDLDVAEIAKRVRQDIKAAKAAGELPAGLACSVRIDRYSMGCSLDVRVTALPWQPLEWITERRWSQEERRVTPTEQAKRVLDSLLGIVRAYSRRDIDSSTDYYNVNFSDDVKLDGDFERSCEATLGPDPETLPSVVLRLVESIAQPDHTLIDWLELLDQPEAPVGDWADYIAREVR